MQGHAFLTICDLYNLQIKQCITVDKITLSSMSTEMTKIITKLSFALTTLF